MKAVRNGRRALQRRGKRDALADGGHDRYEIGAKSRRAPRNTRDCGERTQTARGSGARWHIHVPWDEAVRACRRRCPLPFPIASLQAGRNFAAPPSQRPRSMRPGRAVRVFRLCFADVPPGVCDCVRRGESMPKCRLISCEPRARIFGFFPVFHGLAHCAAGLRLLPCPAPSVRRSSPCPSNARRR